MTVLYSTISKSIRYFLCHDTKHHKDHDIEILRAFIKVYCQCHHKGHRCQSLCDQCESLLKYAVTRREKCPYDPKPACKNCRTHCYAKSYRDRIRDVMKFSGMYFVKRGRIDWLIQYYLR